MTRWTYPEEITNLLFLGGFLLVVSYSLLLWAWEGEKIKLYSWLHTTQRKRYGAVLLANGFAAIALYPLYKYGWVQTVGALSEVRHEIPYFGWIVTVFFYALLAIPVVSLLVTFDIYRHPAYLAKRARGKDRGYLLYVRTEDVRRSKKPYASVPPPHSPQ